MFGNYAIIVFATEDDMIDTTGTVYGWYEALATAVNTAVNLRQQGNHYHVVVVKVV